MRIKFNEDESEVDLVLLSGEIKTYSLKKPEEIPKTENMKPFTKEWDTIHSIKQLKKVNKIIIMEDGKCTCGVNKYHAHCMICGKLLKILREK